MSPAHDERRTELTDREVEAKIADRTEVEKRARNRTKGGVLIGSVALAFAAWAGLVNDNTLMSFMGFAVSLVGFGISSPEQAKDMIGSLFGGGK